MGVRKKAHANLRASYPIYVEIGTILALLVVILALRIGVRTDHDFEVTYEEREVVPIEAIAVTTQAPPPPAPRPVEVPNDEIIEGEPVELDASLVLEMRPRALETPLAVRAVRIPEHAKKIIERKVFVIVEEEPEMIGGLEALRDAIEYPEDAERAGIEGTVFIQFIVDKHGEVRSIHVLRGVHELLNRAAVEGIAQMQFEPGKQRGRPVNVQMTIPIRFKLL